MRTLSKIVEKPKEYPFDPSRKHDVRDVVTFYKDGKRAWEYLYSHMTAVDMETPDEDITAVACNSFDDLNNLFKKHLHWTQLSSDALLVSLAVVVSVRIKGPLLWTYLIGSSGCGKSTICEAISADKIHIKRVNSFTGLHSGYKTGDPDKPDVSLISKLPGKALVVPDFTTVLSMSAQMQEKTYGELRNIYDGISSMHYGNDTEREYTKITFPMVAGVTHEIHGLRKSALGERFLKVDMTDREASRSIIRRNIQNVANSASNSLVNNSTFDEVDELNPFMRDIKAHTLGFMQHLFRKIAGGVKVKLPDWFVDKLESLAIIVAAARGEVKRQPGADREMVYRPVLEVGSHVAGQLTKLAIALSVVIDRDPDQEVLRLVQKVGMDTAHGLSFDIIKALGESEKGLTNDQVASKVRLPPSNVRRITEDLRELGVVYKQDEESASGIAGRGAHVLYLAPQFQACWEEIHGPAVKVPRRL